MENKSKQIIKPNFQSIKYWIMRMKKKNSIKKWPKKRSYRLTYQTCDLGHNTKMTPLKKNKNKLQSLIFNQSNIEGWN